MTVRLYAHSEQAIQVEEILTFLKNNGLEVEPYYTDVNEDAKAHIEKFNLLVTPVLFALDPIQHEECIKFAEGEKIVEMSAEKIAEAKAIQEFKPQE